MSRRMADSPVGQLVGTTVGAVLRVVSSILGHPSPEEAEDGSPFARAAWDDEPVTAEEARRIDAALLSKEPPVPWSDVKAEAEAKRSA
jgi:hypothetical protein